MEIVLSIAVGISLSATSGFRVFIPFLVLSAASLAGRLELRDSYAWLGTYPALSIFAAAAVAELLAYLIPWVDNALNVLSVPASVLAGTALTYAFVGDLGPGGGMILSILVGGGASLAARGISTIVHAGSTAASGGAANPALSFAETLGSAALSVLALAAPVIGVLLLILFLIWLVRLVRRIGGQKQI